MQMTKTIIVLGLCTSIAFSESGLAGSRNASKKTGKKIIAAFDKTAKGFRRRPQPPDYINYEIRRISPDGKYVAQLTIGDGEVGYLIVYRRQRRTKALLKRHAVSRRFEDVQGCAWVPRHGHWLVISTGGADYGPGMIALWTGHKRVRLLCRAKSLEGEGFNLIGVSADGRTIVYEHFGLNSPDPNYKRNTRLYMTLPRS